MTIIFFFVRVTQQLSSSKSHFMNTSVYAVALWHLHSNHILQMEGLLPALVILHVLGLVAGFPNGAPTSACEDMMPRHTGVQPQPTRAPYTILTNSKTFQPGQPITGEMIRNNFNNQMYGNVSLSDQVSDAQCSVKATGHTTLVECHNPQMTVILMQLRNDHASGLFCWATLDYLLSYKVLGHF